jgi:hypothetical protein
MNPDLIESSVLFTPELYTVQDYSLCFNDAYSGLSQDPRYEELTYAELSTDPLPEFTEVDQLKKDGLYETITALEYFDTYFKEDRAKELKLYARHTVSFKIECEDGAMQRADIIDLVSSSLEEIDAWIGFIVPLIVFTVLTLFSMILASGGKFQLYAGLCVLSRITIVVELIFMLVSNVSRIRVTLEDNAEKVSLER